jgi:hypothetical protein
LRAIRVAFKTKTNFEKGTKENAMKKISKNACYKAAWEMRHNDLNKTFYVDLDRGKILLTTRGYYELPSLQVCDFDYEASRTIRGLADELYRKIGFLEREKSWEEAKDSSSSKTHVISVN